METFLRFVWEIVVTPAYYVMYTQIKYFPCSLRNFRVLFTRALDFTVFEFLMQFGLLRVAYGLTLIIFVSYIFRLCSAKKS